MSREFIVGIQNIILGIIECEIKRKIPENKHHYMCISRLIKQQDDSNFTIKVNGACCEKNDNMVSIHVTIDLNDYYQGHDGGVHPFVIDVINCLIKNKADLTDITFIYKCVEHCVMNI